MNTWDQAGSNYYLGQPCNQSDSLKPGIYLMNYDERKDIYYLSLTHDKFEFNYKIYGVEDKFINHVVTTYNNTKGNLGILLNGIKGTGKTVTAELICDKIGIPVIIVHRAYPGISNFLSEIHQDIIVFFDEFEKIYDDSDHSVLTVMDGVLNTLYRKTFLLTTNNLWVNDNLLQRPGRIRYVKTFGDLSLESILEIVDDKLIYTKFKKDIIKFISSLEIITVDIVKAVIDEVNVHNTPPSTFAGFFNTKQSENKHDIYVVDKDHTETLKVEGAQITPKRFDSDSEGCDLNINGNYVGIIENTEEGNCATVRIYAAYRHIFEKKEVSKGGRKKLISKPTVNEDAIFSIKIKNTEEVHKRFRDFAF